jgi:hypothetical protein
VIAATTQRIDRMEDFCYQGAVTCSTNFAATCGIVLTLCATQLAFAEPARSFSVRTRDGVTFYLPASFSQRALPAQGSTPAAELERVYVDTGSPPILLVVSRSSAQASRSLPQPSERVTSEYRAGFVQGVTQSMKVSQVLETTPGEYDPEHAAFTVTLKARVAGEIESLTSVAFFTRSGSVQILIRAAEARDQSARALAKEIVTSSQIISEAKLEVSMFHELEDLSAFTFGRLLGAIVGPLIAVLLLGGGVGWLLTRAGTRATWAAMAGCAAIVLLYMVVGLGSGERSVFTMLQIVSVSLSSALLVKPLDRWLRARQRV